MTNGQFNWSVNNKLINENPSSSEASVVGSTPPTSGTIRVGSALGNAGTVVLAVPDGVELVRTASGLVCVREADVLEVVMVGTTKDEAVRNENCEGRASEVEDTDEEVSVSVAVADTVPVPLIDPDVAVDVRLRDAVGNVTISVDSVAVPVRVVVPVCVSVFVPETDAVPVRVV